MSIFSAILASVLPILVNHNEIGGIDVVTNTVEYVTSATNDAVTEAYVKSTNYTFSVVSGAVTEAYVKSTNYTFSVFSWDLVLSQDEYIPASAYRSAHGLHSVTSSPGIAIDVGTKAFAGLRNLKYIHLDTVADNDNPIADNAFQDLNLESLTILNRPGLNLYCNNTRGFAGAYTRELNAPAITGLKSHAFEDSYLKNAKIQGMRNIEAATFKNCSCLCRVEAPNCTNLCDYAFFNCTSNSELQVGLLIGMGASPNNTLKNMGQQAIPHADGKRVWLLAKNMTSDFMNRFASSGMGGMSTDGKVFCYDGYIVHNGTTWESHTYESIANLPIPGSSQYIYKIGSKYYQWDGGSYVETVNNRLVGFFDASESIPKINATDDVSGTLKLYYETDSMEKLPNCGELGTLTWETL